MPQIARRLAASASEPRCVLVVRSSLTSRSRGDLAKSGHGGIQLRQLIHGGVNGWPDRVQLRVSIPLRHHIVWDIDFDNVVALTRWLIELFGPGGHVIEPFGEPLALI